MKDHISGVMFLIWFSWCFGGCAVALEPIINYKQDLALAIICGIYFLFTGQLCPFIYLKKKL